MKDVAPVDGYDVEAGACGSDPGQAPLDGAADLRIARRGVDHQTHLRRGMGLYRAMVRRETCATSSSASAPDLSAKYVAFQCA